MTSYREAVGTALREALEGDERVILMGQDIGARGGAYGVTAGLLDAFGPERVRDAPSSEAALVGVAIGAAIAGLRPVVELTTASFAALAFDQLLHHAAPLRTFSAGRLTAPLVVRMPQGGGARLGPVHTQTLEALLHHIPGLVVATPATPADARGLLAAAIASADPVVVLEHAALYDTQGTLEDQVDVLGRAVVRRAGSDVTLVGSSRMAIVAQEAAERLAAEHDVDAEVIDLRTVAPLDHATIAASVRRTRHAVLVEEGWPDGGIGATIAARLDHPVVRVTGAAVAAPYAASLAALTVPDAAAVVDATLRLLAPRTVGDMDTISTTIDLEPLRRSGVPLAQAIVSAVTPLLTDAAIILPDGTIAVLGRPHSTLTFGPTTTRPTVVSGAVTIHHTAPLTLRHPAAEAPALLAALRDALEREGAS